MFPVEWVAIVPFVVVGVIWFLINDEEFDRRFKEWVEENKDKNVKK